MHLTLLAVGSRGDVQPFIALGLGLQKAGYTVRFATHSIFEATIREAGLEFAPLEGNPQAIVQGEEGRAWMESERNPFKFASGFRRLMGPVVRQAMQDALVASEGSRSEERRVGKERRCRWTTKYWQKDWSDHGVVHAGS